MSTSQPVVDGPPVPQVCQRCRRTFAGDSSLLPGAMIEWWACGACRIALGLDPPA